MRKLGYCMGRSSSCHEATGEHMAVRPNGRQSRSKPSAWPVYVIGALIGVYSLISIGWVWFVPWMAQIPPSLYEDLPPGSQEFAGFMQRLAPYAFLFGVYGVFGIVTAVGAILFRPWGWWCVVVWTTALVVCGVLGHFNLRGWTSPWAILWSVAWGTLIVWPLMTRRRLYFPPI